MSVVLRYDKNMKTNLHAINTEANSIQFPQSLMLVESPELYSYERIEMLKKTLRRYAIVRQTT